MRPACEHYRGDGCGNVAGGCCRHPDTPYGPQPSHGVCNQCVYNAGRGRPMPAPAGDVVVQVRMPADAERAKSRAEQDAITRGLWRELHERAASIGSIELVSELQWLSAWSERVPCGECKRHWHWLWDLTPADLSSAAAYFAWTVRVHNMINARIGKPTVSVADALHAVGIDRLNSVARPSPSHIARR